VAIFTACFATKGGESRSTKLAHASWPHLETSPAAMSSLFARNRTFRPTKSHGSGTKRYDLHKHAQATLGKCVP